MQNIVVDMCEKFHNDRLRNDRALVLWKSDNKNPKKKHNHNKMQNNVDSACMGTRFGSKNLRGTQSYTNELHDALNKKNSRVFWKCWKSKFEFDKNKCRQVDGCVDAVTITDNFAKYFESTWQNDRMTDRQTRKVKIRVAKAERSRTNRQTREATIRVAKAERSRTNKGC